MAAEGGDEDLFVFGYACKLFRDDETAAAVDQKMMPWHGQTDLMIDRYAMASKSFLFDFHPSVFKTATPYLKIL